MTGAGLLIMRPEDGLVLLVRRAPGMTYEGFWSVPGGGVEEGETELEAALRETEEEVCAVPGLEVVDEEPSWDSPGPWFAFVTFVGVIGPGHEEWEPRLDFEHDAWKWVHPERLPRGTMPGTVRAVELLVLDPMQREA